FDEFVERLPFGIGGANQHQTAFCQRRHWLKGIGGVLDVFVCERHNHDRARRGAHQCVAIGRAIGHRAGTYAAACTGPVIQNDVLPQEFVHAVQKGPKHVVGITWLEGDNDLNLLVGEVSCCSCVECCHGSHGCGDQCAYPFCSHTCLH